jgi:hypothetical protein
MVVADRGEPVLGIVHLTRDHLLDVGVKRSVRAKDELAQQRDPGAVFSGLDTFGPVVWIRPTALSVLCRYRHSTDYAGPWIMPTFG